MKKRFALILCFFIALFITIVINYSERDNRVEFVDAYGFPNIRIKYRTDSLSILHWEDPETEIIHFFIPGGVDTSEISCTKTALFINDNRVKHLQYDKDKEYAITYNGIEKRVVFHVLDSISSVFVDTESKTMNNIHGNKDCSEQGHAFSLAENGLIEYDGGISIKGHGNGSWGFEKKPYGVELKNRGCFAGLNDVKDLVLLALSYDGDKIHSKLGLDLSKLLNPEMSVDSNYVNLYLNGEYAGLYLAAEAPKKKKQFRNTSTDFLVEKDISNRCVEGESIVVDNAYYFAIIKPKELDEDGMLKIENVLQNVDSDIRSGKISLIDLNSFAAEYLTEELSLNHDAFVSSSFFYKLKGDECLYAGPSWDFDGAFGEYLHRGENWVNPQGSCFEENNERLDWYEMLVNNEEFAKTVELLLAKKNADLTKLFTEDIDYYQNLISYSVYCDNARWKWTEIRQLRPGTYQTWENDVRYLKWFCSERLYEVCKSHGIETELAVTYNERIKHTVKFAKKDGTTVSVIVNDFDMINPARITGEEDTKWMFDYSGEEFSSFLPILEDCKLVPLN